MKRLFIFLLLFVAATEAALAAANFPAGIVTSSSSALGGVLSVTGTLSGVLTGTATTISGTIPASQVSGLNSAATTGTASYATTATTISGTLPSTQVSGSAVFGATKSIIASTYAAGMESLMTWEPISNGGSVGTVGTIAIANGRYNSSFPGATTGAGYRSIYFDFTEPSGTAFTTNFSVPFVAKWTWSIVSNFTNLKYVMMIGASHSSYPPVGKSLSFAITGTNSCEVTLVHSSGTSTITGTGNFTAGTAGVCLLEWNGSNTAKAYVSSGTAFATRPTLVATATGASSGAAAAGYVIVGVYCTGTSPETARSASFWNPKIYYPGTN